VAWEPGAKNTFFLHLFGAILQFCTLKRSIYQDRLGTNIGKVEGKELFWQVRGSPHRMQRPHNCGAETVKKRLLAPFIYKMHHSTKTGSGQT
jgi:hypothetical protein